MPSHLCSCFIPCSILEMEKAIRHNERAGDRPMALAKQLIDFEEKNIQSLKKYL